MNSLKIAFLTFTVTFTLKVAVSQNVLINVLTKDAGIVRIGGIVFLEVTVNNTDPVHHIGTYKVKTQISVSSAVASVADTGHVLPTGWKVISNDGSTINLSNGMDMIAATDRRTILIAIRGDKIGGPSMITGQLSFSDGNAPGTAPGFLSGDNPADNSSTTSCEVIK